MAPRVALRIALVGDRDDEAVAHRAIPVALDLAASAVDLEGHAEWVATDSIDRRAPSLSPFHGVWCVPGSPYQSTEGAIAAIRFARERGIPFLGTCGGFQHAVLEIAESLWGVQNPAHAELTPGARDPIVEPLACSLIEWGGPVRFAPGSKLACAYGREDAVEEYHCSYGLAVRCRRHLARGPLWPTAWDAEGDVRAVELDNHPFFVGTLFQPERAALRGEIPPIVAAFVAAMAARG